MGATITIPLWVWFLACVGWGFTVTTILTVILNRRR